MTTDVPILIIGSPTALGGHFAGMDRGPAELWVMEADGTDPVPVLDPPAEIGGYDWVP